MISLQRCHKVTDVGLASIASTGVLRVLGANKVGSLGLLTIKALIAACRYAQHLPVSQVPVDTQQASWITWSLYLSAEIRCAVQLDA